MHHHSENTWMKCELHLPHIHVRAHGLGLTFLPTSRNLRSSALGSPGGAEEELELLECKPEASLEQQVTISSRYWVRSHSSVLLLSFLICKEYFSLN